MISWKMPKISLVNVSELGFDVGIAVQISPLLSLRNAYSAFYEQDDLTAMIPVRSFSEKDKKESHALKYEIFSLF